MWTKIANRLNNLFKKREFSGINVENKWKCLKRTYKTIKIKNNTSGNKRKNWQYFSAMNEVLGHKPEITPPATCSSTLGLQILKNESEKKTELQDEYVGNQEETPSTSGTFESNLSKKRKSTPNANDRHKDKMARQDKFLQLFETMIGKM